MTSSTIQEPVPAGPSEEAQPAVAATDEHTKKDPLPASDREVQIIPIQEDVTLNREDPAISSGFQLRSQFKTYQLAGKGPPSAEIWPTASFCASQEGLDQGRLGFIGLWW